IGVNARRDAPACGTNAACVGLIAASSRREAIEGLGESGGRQAFAGPTRSRKDQARRERSAMDGSRKQSHQSTMTENLSKSHGDSFEMNRITVATTVFVQRLLSSCDR